MAADGERLAVFLTVTPQPAHIKSCARVAKVLTSPSGQLSFQQRSLQLLARKFASSCCCFTQCSQGSLYSVWFGRQVVHRWAVTHMQLPTPPKPLLQGRARTVGQVLLGYFEVPFNMDDPVSIVVNPQGAEARSATR